MSFPALTEKNRIGRRHEMGRKQAREEGSVGLQTPLRPHIIFCPLEESDGLGKQKFKVTEAWGAGLRGLEETQRGYINR